ncbi:hypothetical protein CLU79DRAFT_225308 [Phycomyces nitens]|nr:hypothetical protein CLU79DRAFT_225308 [Phycomyces nitens]
MIKFIVSHTGEKRLLAWGAFMVSSTVCNSAPVKLPNFSMYKSYCLCTIWIKFCAQCCEYLHFQRPRQTGRIRRCLCSKEAEIQDYTDWSPWAILGQMPYTLSELNKCYVCWVNKAKGPVPGSSLCPYYPLELSHEYMYNLHWHNNNQSLNSAYKTESCGAIDVFPQRPTGRKTRPTHAKPTEDIRTVDPHNMPMDSLVGLLFRLS